MIKLEKFNKMNIFEQQQVVERYKRKFEDTIRRLIYNLLVDYPDDYIKEKFIPNRVEKLNELIKNFEITEEYEKCEFLSNIKEKIKNK